MKILGGIKMSKLVQERIDFIDLLHEFFIKKTGHGAYAFISVADTMNLFDRFLDSGESVNGFIKQYVRCVI